MALSVLLTLEVPLGGFVGISGWLPFRDDIDEMINSDRLLGDEGNEHSFSLDSSPGRGGS